MTMNDKDLTQEELERLLESTEEKMSETVDQVLKPSCRITREKITLGGDIPSCTEDEVNDPISLSWHSLPLDSSFTDFILSDLFPEDNDLLNFAPNSPIHPEENASLASNSQAVSDEINFHHIFSSENLPAESYSLPCDANASLASNFQTVPNDGNNFAQQFASENSSPEFYTPPNHIQPNLHVEEVSGFDPIPLWQESSSMSFNSHLFTPMPAAHENRMMACDNGQLMQGDANMLSLCSPPSVENAAMGCYDVPAAHDPSSLASPGWEVLLAHNDSNALMMYNALLLQENNESRTTACARRGRRQYGNQNLRKVQRKLLYKMQLKAMHKKIKAKRRSLTLEDVHNFMSKSSS